jgi:hypothetical protein
MYLREIGWGMWSGFTWLRIGAGGGLLWARWWTFGFWGHGVSATSHSHDCCRPTRSSHQTISSFWMGSSIQRASGVRVFQDPRNKKKLIMWRRGTQGNANWTSAIGNVHLWQSVTWRLSSLNGQKSNYLERGLAYEQTFSFLSSFLPNHTHSSLAIWEYTEGRRGLITQEGEARSGGMNRWMPHGFPTQYYACSSGTVRVISWKKG